MSDGDGGGFKVPVDSLAGLAERYGIPMAVATGEIAAGTFMGNHVCRWERAARLGLVALHPGGE